MTSIAHRSVHRSSRVGRRLRPVLVATAALGMLAPASGLLAPAAAGVTPAQAAVGGPGVPVVASIQEGVGAAGVRLGMTKPQVAAAWGRPASCVLNSRGEFCSFRSSDGVERAQVRLVGGTSATVSVITVPFSNPTWSTGRGIHVGSTAYPGLGTGPGQFDAAYAGSVDPLRSSYWSRYVPSAGTAGLPSGTRFTLGWINEYLPDQYFAVTGITVQAG